MQITTAQNFTDAEKTLLKAELQNDPNGVGYKRADSTFKTAEELAYLLTFKGTVPNPDPQPNIPAPLNKQELLGMVLPFVGSFTDEALVRVSEAIDNDDRATISLWLTIALQRTWIDQATHDAIAAKLTATIPDPNWKAQVPGQSPIERVVGRSQGISPQEVQQILSLP